MTEISAAVQATVDMLKSTAGIGIGGALNESIDQLGLELQRELDRRAPHPTNANPNLPTANIHFESQDTPEVDEFASVNFANLSPEMILALAERRLNTIDSQIAHAAQEVNERSTEANNLSRALELLHDLSAQGSADGDGDVADWEAVGKSTVPEMIDELHTLGVEVPISDHLYRADALAHAVESVNAKLKSLNSDNEMTMLRLQDAMQSRTALISLTTNVLNSLHEAEKNVIGNMR